MQYKKYNESLKNEFDPKAKKVVLDLLLSSGLFYLKESLELQKEVYKKWDFVVNSKSSNKEIHVECEIKTMWKESGSWQYSLGSSVHVPYRKKDTQADIICIVNNNLDTICVIPVDILKKSDIIVKNTKNRFSGEETRSEKFFSVDIEKCHLYYKNNNDWDNI